MPIRAWFLTGVLWTALAWSAQAQEQIQAPAVVDPEAAPEQNERKPATDNNGNSEQENAVDPSPGLAAIERAIRDLVAATSKADPPQKDEREVRALNAQEEMETWAERMFYATSLTVLLTFLALGAVLRTLHHTRRAADYAGDMLSEARMATVAANQTVEITREAFGINVDYHSPAKADQ